MTTPTTRPSRWFHVYRWPDEAEPDGAIVEAVAREADRLRLTLQHPVAGWVSSRHSPDDRSQPCREHTDGARPAWLWGAS